MLRGPHVHWVDSVQGQWCTGLCEHRAWPEPARPEFLDSAAVAILMGVLFSNSAVFPPLHLMRMSPPVVTPPTPLPSSLLSHGLVFLGKPLLLGLYYSLVLPINCAVAFSEGFTSYWRITPPGNLFTVGNLCPAVSKMVPLRVTSKGRSRVSCGVYAWPASPGSLLSVGVTTPFWKHCRGLAGAGR